MENFGPIGEWRDQYQGQKNRIDASAELADGERYKDIVEFRAILMKRKHLVTRNLAKKLLEYATGRMMEATDHGTLDQITESVQSKGNGLRDLVYAVVQSEPFRMK